MRNIQRLLSPADSLYDCPVLDNFGPNSVPLPVISSGYDYDRMDREMTDMHFTTPEADRGAIINIKDSNDIEGNGMTFNMGLVSTFKHVFNAFKTKSCKNCKSPGEARFKVDGKRLKEKDTPKKFKTKHNHTLSVRVYSTNAGLNCLSCKSSGYPSTNDAQLDGDHPIKFNNEPTGQMVVRLLFEDPNSKIIGIMTKPSHPLKLAMSEYARRAECILGSLNFHWETEKLDHEDTAQELGLINNSLINVYMHQMSG